MTLARHLDAVTNVHGANGIAAVRSIFHAVNWLCAFANLVKAALSAAQALACLDGGEKPSGDIRLLTIWLS